MFHTRFQVGRLILLLPLLRLQHSVILAASFYFLVELEQTLLTKAYWKLTPLTYIFMQPSSLYIIYSILYVLANLYWSPELCPGYTQVDRVTFFLQYCIAFRIILCPVPQRHLYDVLIKS